MTRTGTLHRAAMLAAITVAKVNVFERLLMRKKLARLAAILACLLAVSSTVSTVVAPPIAPMPKWRWAEVIDGKDLAALNKINSQWQLWDFNRLVDDTDTPGPGLQVDWEARPVWGEQPYITSWEIVRQGKAVRISLPDLENFLGDGGLRGDLKGPIPEELGDLSQLQVLNLSRNQLTGPIPASLGNLSQLAGMDLSDNQLTGPIPASLGNLSQLETMGLSGNQLTGPIPEELGDLSQLQTLGLSRNQLTGPIPQELASAQQLYRLAIEHNYLTIDADGQKVLDQIAGRRTDFIGVSSQPQGIPPVFQVTTIHPAPEGISLVSVIPQSRAVKAGKTARSVKLMVMLSNNSLENVPVTVALSAEPSGVITLPQSTISMTVPGKKNAKQKAKTKRQSFTVLVPPTASGDVTIKASVGALSASSTLRVQAVKK